MACSKSFTNNEVRTCIQKIWSKFVVGVDPDRLSDWLIQEFVITPEQWQKIHSENGTSQSRCRALLLHLCAIQHPRAFLVVYKALVEENHYLALDFVKNQESELAFSSLPDRRGPSHIHDKGNTEQQDNGCEDKKRVLDEEKDRLLKMQNDHEDQKRAWVEEKDCLLQMLHDYDRQKREWEEEKKRLLKVQNDHEDQKRAWVEEKDYQMQMLHDYDRQKREWEEEKKRLLKMQNDRETKLPLGTTIVVNNIPEDMSEVTLKMILENKRYDVTNIDYEKGRGSAIITLSDRGVADKFLSLECFTISGNTFYVLSPEKKTIDKKQKFLEASFESQKEAEKDRRTVKVHGVDSAEVAKLLATKMSNRRIGGGAIESELFDENNGVLTLEFKDDTVAEFFLAKKSISFTGRSYDIHAVVKEDPKKESIPLEEVDNPKDRETEERSRIVEVHGVQSKEVAETIVVLLENARRGGGPVEMEFLNENDRTLTVRFYEKKYADHFIQQKVISAYNLPYYIRPPNSSYSQPEIPNVLVENQKSWMRWVNRNHRTIMKAICQSVVWSVVSHSLEK